MTFTTSQLRAARVLCTGRIFTAKTDTADSTSNNFILAHV